MFQYAWQYKTQIPLGFQAVVQHDDGSRAGMLQHVLKAFFRRNFFGKIAAQYVPHDDAKIIFQRLPLYWFEATIRRPEKIALKRPAAFRHILEVVGRVCFPAVQMVESMVADGVAAVQHLLKNGGMLAHVVAHTEKSRFCGVGLQRFQHPRRHGRDRAVVEGEEKRFLICGHTPGVAGHQEL